MAPPEQQRPGREQRRECEQHTPPAPAADKSRLAFMAWWHRRWPVHQRRIQCVQGPRRWAGALTVQINDITKRAFWPLRRQPTMADG
jgi:hypothetical protein